MESCLDLKTLVFLQEFFERICHFPRSIWFRRVEMDGKALKIEVTGIEQADLRRLYQGHPDCFRDVAISLAQEKNLPPASVEVFTPQHIYRAAHRRR